MRARRGEVCVPGYVISLIVVVVMTGSFWWGVSVGHKSGVIAAAQGTHVATRIDLPDGTTEWMVTRTGNTP